MENMDRREFLKRSALGLLGAGLWPGALAAADEQADSSFTFIVINDTHYKDENCARYFEAAFEQMREGPKFDFALIAGDLTTAGTPEEIGAFKQLTDSLLPVPTYCVLGNHDCPGKDRKAWVDAYGMDSINFRFDHKGWTFLGVDTNNRGASSGVVVYPETLAWIRDALRDIPSTRPLVVFGHHPFGEKVTYQVVNAEELLSLFLAHNLKHVFNGHFHGLTERERGKYGLTTNRCLSLSRGNHDGSTEKGYFFVKVDNGKLGYEFVEFKYEG